MKRNNLLISLVILIILVVNVYYYMDIYTQQVEFQKNFLLNQAQLCSNEIEKTSYSFESDANYILYSEDMTRFFEDDQIKQGAVKKFELLYSKYPKLITNILFYDNNKNVFNIFRDETNHFIKDFYLVHNQRKLYPREKVQKIKEEELFILPVFENNEVAGNLIISLNTIGFINNVFTRYHLENTFWQWLLDSKGKIISNNIYPEKNIKLTQYEKITSDLKNGDPGFILHEVIAENLEEEIISGYYPIRILKNEFAVIFSLKSEIILRTIIRNSLIIAGLNLILILLILLIYRNFIKKHKQEEQKLMESQESLNEIIEKLPLGIVILSKNRIIEKVNSTALKLFSFKETEPIVNQNFEDKFQFNTNFLPNASLESFSDEQYMLYKREGEDFVILSKEIPVSIHGDEKSLLAFIDVTPLENARKQEVNANKAKSEFLAKMSHEIRTPLNGIVGMSETLINQNLTEEQAEYAKIIKKSADLLLSIITDILDFSKIEAGRMELEFIPFLLRSELENILDLFRPNASEKNIIIHLMVDDDVPDKLIGDVFRLKQVISNLVGNAVKFTPEGIIQVKISLAEKGMETISILFCIEDTGIGIPKENIDKIFGSFTQADGSTTRRFGGTGLGTTISKQLVELMSGDIWVESPSSISTNPKLKGSKFCFTAEVFSNEKITKFINFEEIVLPVQLQALLITSDNSQIEEFPEVVKDTGIQLTEYTEDDEIFESLENEASSDQKRSVLMFVEDSETMNGFSFVKKLKAQQLVEHFVVIITSVNHDPKNYLNSKKAGADGYIPYPIKKDILLEFIKNFFPKLDLSSMEKDFQKYVKKDLSILVAEDNFINQRVVQTMFRNMGYTIDIAENGKEVLEKVKEKKYDIIFMDIMMPEMDGLQASSILRNQGFTEPIIAVTAVTSKEDITLAYEKGVNEYITKPFKINDIKAVLVKYFSEI